MEAKDTISATTKYWGTAAQHICSVNIQMTQSKRDHFRTTKWREASANGDE
jgi:hypothetical protein